MRLAAGLYRSLDLFRVKIMEQHFDSTYQRVKVLEFLCFLSLFLLDAKSEGKELSKLLNDIKP